MEYQTLKLYDIRPEGYEHSVKNKNNWVKGNGVGHPITEGDLNYCDYRVPIIPPKRRVKIERTLNRTYTVSAIAEAQKLAEEGQKLSRRITEISIEITKILEGRIS
jgi:hypothetical protein